MDNQPKKLYRSRAQRQIGGICGGLGEYFNVDPTVMRIAFVAGFFFNRHSDILGLFNHVDRHPGITVCIRSKNV